MRLRAEEGPWLQGGRWPCQLPRGFASVFGATLAGNRSVCLTQCRLRRQGETHLWVCAIARSGREGRVSEMQERKEKAPSSLSSLLPPWPMQVPVLFSPGLHSVHSSLACQARAMLSASMVGTLARHGAEFRHLPGWGAREGGGGTVGHTQVQILQRQSLLSRSHQFERGKPKRPK